MQITIIHHLNEEVKGINKKRTPEILINFLLICIVIFPVDSSVACVCIYPFENAPENDNNNNVDDDEEFVSFF